MGSLLRNLVGPKFVLATDRLRRLDRIALAGACTVLLMTLLFAVHSTTALAQVPPAQPPSYYDEGPGLGVEAGDFRIAEFTERMFSLIEGNFGAMIMVIAGLGSIISAAFGAFRAAISLFVVAVGAFILRSLVEIFFNYHPPVG